MFRRWVHTITQEEACVRVVSGNTPFHRPSLQEQRQASGLETGGALPQAAEEEVQKVTIDAHIGDKH